MTLVGLGDVLCLADGVRMHVLGTVVGSFDDGHGFARVYPVGINTVSLQIPYTLDLVGFRV